MAINQEIISTSWEGQQKSYIEAGLKTLLQRMLEVLESPLAANSVGSNQLTQELRDVINSIGSKVPNTRTVNSKELSSNITIGPDDIMVGNQTLADKLDDMDDAIGQGGDTSGLASRITALESTLDKLTGTNDSTQVIDTFNEVIDFLANVNNNETLLGKLQQLQNQISSKANAADVVKTVSVNNGTPAQPDGNGNVNIEVSGGGETVVINSDGANIVDSHTNPSILFAPSARQMAMAAQNINTLFTKINDLYDKLAGIAFTDGKPAGWKVNANWSTPAIPTHTITLGTMTNVSASLNGTTINGSTSSSEGEVTIKLTPSQGAMILTENISIKLSTEDVPFTTAADNGSTLVTFILAGDVTIAASASSGRNIIFTGSTGCSIGAAGVAIGQDLDTTITANEHYTLPQSITVKIGNTNVAHTYTRAQDNKTATLHIDAANITGDLTITCTAVEDAHVTLAISGSNFVVKQGNAQLSNGSKVYNGSAAQTLTIEPASGCKFSTLPSADKGTMTNNGPYEASSLVISTSVSGTLTITAAGAALGTFNIDLSGVTSDVGVTWTNPSASAQTILEGSPFKITLAKVSGTGVLQIGTCAMNGGTLTPNNWVIETAHVTGDITIAASVAAAPMKVHSYDFTDVQLTDGRVDGKPKYIEDDVAGHFRLYSVNNITQNSEATEDDPAWVAPKWSPNSGSYKGSWANGINNNYRAGYGNRVLDLEPGSDFTIILKEYSLYPASGNRYKTAQIQVIFHDRSNVGVGNQLVAQQFEIQCGLTGDATYIGNGGSMYPVINTTSGLVSLRGDNAKVPATPAAGDVYDVVFSYVAQTGLMSAFVVKRGSSSEVLVGGTMTKTGLAITCMQVYGYGSSVPTHLKGIELYNYAMDKTALETLYGITSND